MKDTDREFRFTAARVLFLLLRQALGVTKTATPAELKSAFRKLASPHKRELGCLRTQLQVLVRNGASLWHWAMPQSGVVPYQDLQLSSDPKPA